MINRQRVHELREKRFAYLKRLCELALQGQDEARSQDVAAELSISDIERNEIEDFLNDEGCIAFTAFGPIVEITTWGKRFVEEAVIPVERSESPQVNVVEVQNMVGSVIQQGTTASSATATFNGLEAHSVLALVNEMRAAADGAAAGSTKAQALADLASAEAQLKSPSPNREIVTACLRSAWLFAHGTGVGVTAQAISKQLGLV